MHFSADMKHCKLAGSLGTWECSRGAIMFRSRLQGAIIARCVGLKLTHRHT